MSENTNLPEKTTLLTPLVDFPVRMQNAVRRLPEDLKRLSLPTSRRKMTIQAIADHTVANNLVRFCQVPAEYRTEVVQALIGAITVLLLEVEKLPEDKTLTPDEVLQLAQDIPAFYPTLTAQDVVHCLDLVRRGELEDQVYGRLTQKVVFKWLKAYEAKRKPFIERARRDAQDELERQRKQDDKLEHERRMREDPEYRESCLNPNWLTQLATKPEPFKRERPHAFIPYPNDKPTDESDVIEGPFDLPEGVPEDWDDSPEIEEQKQ